MKALALSALVVLLACCASTPPQGPRAAEISPARGECYMKAVANVKRGGGLRDAMSHQARFNRYIEACMAAKGARR